MASSKKYLFNFIIIGEDGTILYTDIKTIGQFEVGTSIYNTVGLIQSDLDKQLFHIRNGMLLICPVSTKIFRGYIGLIYDANQRECVIDRLLESNKELEAIFESSYDGIVVANNDGKLMRINSSYQRITGVKREEILGLNMHTLVKQGIVSDSATLQVLKTGKPSSFNQLFKSGRHSIITANPIYDENNKIFRIITNVRDMTEVYRLTNDLAESRKQISHYSKVVETLSEGQVLQENLIYKGPAMNNIIERAIKYAKVDATVLITGESGVGKEVIADLIYKYSSRRGSSFMKINCGAIPEMLLESELFGYEGGAFSGARKEGKVGMLELAHNGTVLLDEIGELPLALQVKLLRFVQQREFYRIGGKKLVKVDVRIIAATNRNLEIMMHDGTFRSDLYYRLNVLAIKIPPLRERREDIIPLVNHFLDQYNTKYNVKKTLSPEVYRLFMNYQWEGNIREMENLIERLVVICEKDEISVDYLPEELTIILNDKDNSGLLTFREAKEIFEKKFLTRAIEKYRSTRKVAEMLDIDHSTVVKKAAKYKIDLPNKINSGSL